jgi:hypothetical protein
MSATIRFELRLEIDVPVDEGDDPRDYITQQEKSRLEREILALLRARRHDVTDIEVMDTTIIEPETDPRANGDDDGREYGDPRDEQEERLLR